MPRLFETRCPNCLAVFSLDVALLGRRGRCARCGSTFALKELTVDDSLIAATSDSSASASTGSYVSSKSASASSNADAASFAPDAPFDAALSDDSLVAPRASDGDASASRAASPFGLDADESDALPDDLDETGGADALPAEFADAKFPPPPPGVWRAGERLVGGAYQVLPLAPDKLYAEGGVGVVQRVRHVEWGVDLVVKSPKPSVVATEAGKESFEQECRTWIGLGLHPNIVSCYFVRRIAGIPRLFAELAPDGTLRDWIADGRLYAGTRSEALARVLDVAIQFAWGLEHAHRLGLLHLDVKPSNVMTVGSTIKVTDFGLSKVAAQSSDGALVAAFCDGMTPSYCSPEQYEAFQIYRQKRGSSRGGGDAPSSDAASPAITRQSDIWSWAISVLAMFHGRSPCKMGGQTAAEVFEAFLAAPRSAARPAPPPRCVELLRRCFRKNPAERPESMQAVADELVSIYEEEFAEKYPRRQPRDAASTAESFSNRAISLLELGRTDEAFDLLRKAVAANPLNPQIVFNQTLARWRVGATTDLQAVERLDELVKNRPNDASASYALGLLHVERCNLRSAVDAFERAAELAPDRDDVRRALERARKRLPNDAQCLRRVLLRKKDAKTTPRLYAAVDGSRLLVPSGDENFLVLSAKTGEPQATFVKTARETASVVDAASPVAVSDDYRWNLFRPESGVRSIVPAAGTRSSVRELRFEPVASWGSLEPQTREIRVATPAETPNGEPSSDEKTSDAPKIALTFARDANDVVIYETASQQELRRLPGDGQTLTAFAVSADGRWVATGGDDARIRVWDVERGRQIRTFRGLSGAVEALWFDPRLRFVASLVKGTIFQYWRVGLLCGNAEKLRAPRLLCLVDSSEELGERQARLDATVAAARKAGSRGDVAKIVAAYRDARKIDGWETVRSTFENLLERRARRVRLDDVAQTLRLDAHEGPLSALATSWNGSFAVSAGKDCAIRLWGRPVDAAETAVGASARLDSPSAWKNLLELEGHVDWIRALALSPNDRYLASGGWDQVVYLWDLASGRRLRSLPERVKGVSQLEFAPDGRTLATATEFGAVTLWDAATNEAVFRVQVGSGTARSFRFSRDGRYFATACDDGAVRIWTGRRETPLREISDFPASIAAVDLSCDARLLAAGCDNGKIYVVDLTDATGKTRRVLPGHLGGVRGVRFFADSDWLISNGKDGAARVWNLLDDSEAQTLSSGASSIASTALDFVGLSFFIGEESGALKRWRFRWDYDWPGPAKSPSEIERTVAALAAYYAIGEPLVAQGVPSSAYYGKNATRVVRGFGEAPPLDAKILQKIQAELAYRGFTAVPKETIQKIATALWERKTIIND
ncbi:MAG: protein kinase [Thermoguttaceae bacterium]|nr:protein kinase [Thermoguttaceae bacterium]